MIVNAFMKNVKKNWGSVWKYIIIIALIVVLVIAICISSIANSKANEKANILEGYSDEELATIYAARMLDTDKLDRISSEEIIEELDRRSIVRELEQYSTDDLQTAIDARDNE